MFNNIVLKPKEDTSFFISYLPPKPDWFEAFHSDGEDGETAIVYNGKYYILNGDWRTTYEPLLDKGVDACLEVFKNNQDKISSWSNSLNDLEEK